MADNADISEQEAEFRLNLQIEAARRNVSALDGPNICTKCGERNDRAKAGYAVCSDCVESKDE